MLDNWLNTSLHLLLLMSSMLNNLQMVEVVTDKKFNSIILRFELLFAGRSRHHAEWPGRVFVEARVRAKDWRKDKSQSWRRKRDYNSDDVSTFRFCEQMIITIIYLLLLLIADGAVNVKIVFGGNVVFDKIRNTHKCLALAVFKQKCSLKRAGALV